MDQVKGSKLYPLRIVPCGYALATLDANIPQVSRFNAERSVTAPMINKTKTQNHQAASHALRPMPRKMHPAARIDELLCAWLANFSKG